MTQQQPGGDPLRILLVEDSDLDAELTRATLADGGVAHEVVRVQSAEEFTAAAPDPALDLILSDYILPTFSGMAALRLARELRPDLPFIFVSGALGEELAIESLKNGATDYVLKQRMERLPPAVRRAVGEARERRQRQFAEQRLRESEQRWELAVEASQDGIWDWNPVTDDVYFSPQWKRQLGYEDHELPNARSSFFDRVHPDDRAAMQRAIDDHLGGRTPLYSVELRLRHKDGTYRWIHSRAKAIRSPADGRAARMLGTHSDVTPRKQAEAELRRAKEQAEAASRAKDEFLAVLSHELRTPLTPVVMTVDALLAEPEVPEAVRTELEMVRRNVALESRLIDDLLDLSRIVNGRMALHMQPADASALLAAVWDMVAADARAKRVDVEWELRAVHDRLDADPARLQQVFWNVIKNAIKFTPEGGIVRIRTRDEPPAPGGTRGWLVVQVCDTGIGIPPELLPRVFNAFEQGGHGTEKRFTGLGMGLAIARAITEMHGGSIEAESGGQGCGAAFTIRLPTTVRTAPSDAAPPSDAPAAGGGQRVRVLLVEDHPDTLKTLRKLLESAGYAVRTASTVSAAVDVIDAHPFDILVSDVGLPDGTGHDLMRRIRARGMRTPGIAITGYGMDHDVRASHAAGFDVHMTKPIDMSELEATMRRLIRAAASARAVPT